jgi:2-isopropylmalate synthase
MQDLSVKRPVNLQFLDETLRDGLQSVSVSHPSLNEKLQIIRLMEKLGINSVNLGMAFSSSRFCKDVEGLARAIKEEELSIKANSPARMITDDIDLIVEIISRTETPIEVCTFIASSPIRVLVEGWKLEKIVKDVEKTITRAVNQSVEEILFVTEDTTRSSPEVLKKLITVAVESGANRIAICDTTGHATPHGTKKIVEFTHEVINDLEKGKIGIDWHAHRDRGLALANTLSAIKAGATRIHATALGLGERSGNLSMELLLVNCKMLGWIDNTLYSLMEYSQKVSDVTEVPIPPSVPVIGDDAFKTQTGIHASALVKAKKLGDTWLEDRVYSSVPAEWVNREQRIEIGPQSGRSNVIWWLVHHQFSFNFDLVKKILKHAKKQQRILTDTEILKIIRDHGPLPELPER